MLMFHIGWLSHVMLEEVNMGCFLRIREKGDLLVFFPGMKNNKWQQQKTAVVVSGVNKKGVVVHSPTPRRQDMLAQALDPGI